MVTFLLWWVNYWRKNKKVFIFLLILFVGFLASIASKISLNENVNNIFPNQKIEKILSSSESKKVFIFLKTSSPSIDIQEVKDNLVSKLKTKFQNKLSFNKTSQQNEYFERKFYSNTPFYLEESDYIKAQERLNSLDSILENNHKLLYSPTSGVKKEFIFKDPLNLMGLVLNNHQGFLDSELFKFDSESQSIITFNLADASIPSSTLIYKELKQLKSEYKNKNIELEYFSTSFIPVVNSLQIKKDLNFTLSFTIILILLILVLVFRSYLLPLLFIMPAVFGMIFSLALIYLTKGNISGIALGSGAIIFGIVIDYSFHFFSHLEHNKDSVKTIKELFKPLIFSAFTTIMAFYALTLTNSQVLSDFGWFAAFGLLGSLFFVLFILPIISPNLRKDKSPIVFKIDISNRTQKHFGIGIILITILLAFKVSDVTFDSNIENLNYFPDELKNVEKQLLNIDSDNNKNLLIYTEGNNKEDIKINNLELFHILKGMKINGKIISFSNFSLFNLPTDIIKERSVNWEKFWKENSSELNDNLEKFIIKNNYQNNAYEEFLNLVESKPFFSILLPNESVGLTRDGDKWVAKSIITLDKEEKDEAIDILRYHNINYIDKAGIATEILGEIKDDFNFLLFYTGILVFLTLLLVYGRFELALITFLPMIISWIWILGISAILNIQFNFVNIIISTLIFGIGDDFAIFISDGHLRKHKTNEDIISINFKSIFLSAITTIIALGSLIFAKHPAINSIAPISIIGMFSILLISFFLQPLLYKWIITRRSEKGLAPITLSNFISSLFSYTLFIGGSILFSLLTLLLSLIPYSRKIFKPLLHLFIQKMSWLIVFVAINVRMRKFNSKELDFNKPSIIIANHQSFVDILQMLMLSSKIVLVVKDWVYYSPIFGNLIRYLGFITITDGVEKNIDSIKNLIDKGYSIMIFPEGSRSETDNLGRFHKGAFLIAERLKLDITPILLHGYGNAIRKNDFLIKKSIVSYKVIPRIKWNDNRFGTCYQERTKAIKQYFKTELDSFSKEREDAGYLYGNIRSNIDYKGPIIEWYFKIKWRLERRNYEHYNKLIPETAKIYDLGCGYGFLSMFLSLKSLKREIIGIDYDKKKISIAQNYFMFKGDSNLTFTHQDITTSKINRADTIFLNDVLHYLDKDTQHIVLNSCFTGLNENGLIFIRDGEKEISSHIFTKITEFFSTKIFKFNLTNGELNFISKAEIQSIAEENNYYIETHNHSNITSNKLFILKRK
jgi:1-acyl-sn-glycerol-3-phosphate acyltransferase